jgi:hypothetical protein
MITGSVQVEKPWAATRTCSAFRDHAREACWPVLPAVEAEERRGALLPPIDVVGCAFGSARCSFPRVRPP